MLSAVLRGLIRAYQLVVSPLLLPSCRYLPSCSEYAAEAIAIHGPARGLLLAVRRLARCHPWGGSGYDPVPAAHHPARREARSGYLARYLGARSHPHCR
jgi:putative membrane protein insertion efficiency factor